MLVPSGRFLVPLGSLSPVKAAPLADAALTPYHAIKQAGPHLRPGATVVVIPSPSPRGGPGAVSGRGAPSFAPGRGPRTIGPNRFAPRSRGVMDESTVIGVQARVRVLAHDTGAVHFRFQAAPYVMDECVAGGASAQEVEGTQPVLAVPVRGLAQRPVPGTSVDGCPCGGAKL